MSQIAFPVGLVWIDLCEKLNYWMGGRRCAAYAAYIRASRRCLGCWLYTFPYLLYRFDRGYQVCSEG